MAATVLVLNGPNLNLLGQRQPAIYGNETLADVEAQCRALGAELGLELTFRQSNAEHQLIDWIHVAREQVAGLIINPGAYTHTSIAIHDALKALNCPIVEVHISNIHARDDLHRHSKLSSAVKAVICGLGPYGYIVAMQGALHILGGLPASLPAPIRIGPR